MYDGAPRGEREREENDDRVAAKTSSSKSSFQVEITKRKKVWPEERKSFDFKTTAARELKRGLDERMIFIFLASSRIDCFLFALSPHFLFFAPLLLFRMSSCE